MLSNKKYKIIDFFLEFPWNCTKTAVKDNISYSQLTM